MRERLLRSYRELLRQDIIYTIRSLRRGKGVVAIIVTSMALGIGMCSAMASITHTLHDHDLAGVDTRRLVEFTEIVDRMPDTFSPEAFDYWQARVVPSLERSAAFAVRSSSVSYSLDESLPTTSAIVSSAFFDVLPVRPLMGRVLTRGDWESGAGPAVVVGERLLKRYIGAGAEAIGHELQIDGHVYTIVGVLPREVAYPRGASIWIAMGSPAGAVALNDPVLQGVARLKHDRDLEAARAEFQVLSRQRQEYDPTFQNNRGLAVFKFGTTTSRESLSALWILTGASLLGFLIACANVSSLSLLRALSREREVAVRRALGAGAGDIVREAVVENVALALVGGGLGLLVAKWGTNAAAPLLEAYLGVPVHLSVDLQLVMLCLVLAMIAGTGVALVPAIRAAAVDPASALRVSGYTTTTTRSRRKYRERVAVVEVAIALMLTAALVLLGRSQLYVQGFDVGFDSRDVLTVTGEADERRYPDRASRRHLWETALQEIEGIPGVVSVAAWHVAFLKAPTNDNATPIVREGETERLSPRTFPIPVVLGTRDLLPTLGIQIVRGRASTDWTEAGFGKAAFISEEAARLLWPASDALGRRAKLQLNGSREEWITVVGIVENTALVHESGLGLAVYDTAKRWPQVYLLTDNPGSRSITLGLRAAIAPNLLVRQVRDRLRSLSSEFNLDDIVTLHEVMASSWKLGELRLHVRVLLVTTAIAMVLALVGVYGVVADLVRTRTREIGIRMALGATPFDTTVLIARAGLRVGGVGVAIGGIAAFWTYRLLQTELFGLGPGRGPILYGVKPTDLWVYVLAAAVSIAIVLLASIIPASRAARISPMDALRYE